MIKKDKILRLKVICNVYNISSHQMAEGVSIKMHPGYIRNVWSMNYGITKPRQKEIIDYLIKNEVPKELSEIAFEPVNEIEELVRLGKKLSIDEKLQNPDEKLLNLGVMMLRRQVLKHFGLKTDPFLPLEMPFQSRAFSACREVIEDALQNKAFLAISGPTGCGKSTLWVWLSRRLILDGNNKLVSIYRFDKSMIKVGDIYRAILKDLAKERPNRSFEETHRRVLDLLIENARAGYNTIFLVNEAHDLSNKALVMLKRLWESFEAFPEYGYYRACTIILLGQEGLESMLRMKTPELREVSQRTDLEIFSPLSKEEVEPYLEYRFSGENGAFERVFDKSALEFMVTKNISLTPQLVNVMASRAMYAAFQVGSKKTTDEHVGRLLV